MKTFPLGGIHPHDYKITASSQIERAPIPESVSIFTSQHIGAPAEVLVTKGDRVKVGQLIAKGVGFISAPVHSSVSGTVASIDMIVDGGGVRKMAVTITVEGDVWEESIDRSEVLVERCDLNPAQIIERIAAAGVVGLGGATFPTNVKLSPPPGVKAEILIVNGVECEPYLTADHRLMIERADELIVSCRIVMRALGVNHCAIGIENNKKDAIALLKTKANDGVEIIPLKVQYPQGGEKQLIAAITSRRVPSGALPIKVGAVVQSVGTMIAIYEAVQKNKPLFERVTTVTGTGMPCPKNLLVRVGTPISDLIRLCGGDPDATDKTINGGPMMGRAMSNPSAPTTKGTSGVLVIPVDSAMRPTESPCISCAKCVNACPMGLEPYLLSKLSRMGYFERVVEERATDCIECGCCSYTCPAAIPLLDYIRLGKTEAMKIVRNSAKVIKK